MRATRGLRDRVARKRVTATMAALMPQPQQPNAPDVFYATSGESRAEIAAWPYLPHHNHPTVGFTPNP